MSAERLGNILIRQGVIDTQKLDFCLKVQKNNGGERIGRVLKHYDFISENQIAAALAEQVGWAVYDGEHLPDETAVDLFGLPFLMEHMAFPLSKDGQLVFLLSRCDDTNVTDMIQFKLNRKIDFYIVSESKLRQSLENLALARLAKNNPLAQSSIEDNLSIWIDDHINQAIAQGATDIHIEPSQKAVEIRFRIDGMLCFIDSLRLLHLPRLVNIIFHKADVTVSDFGHFHDARFTHQYLNRSVDVRVSHIPSVNGSSIVLRLLDKGRAAASLASLGYGEHQWNLIQDNLNKPEGLTLVVGPTGCGKTTTLYAMINQLKSISRKIVSIEDPVEMHVPLVTQVQINDKREVTFNDTVRAFLRHDPNIILIGEIRDRQTAQEAIRAAMTGHKVFATIHANRPVDAILRLNDLGVPYTHLAGNLGMIITQRLVRRLSDIGGYRGRAAVAEVLLVDEKVEELIGAGDIALLRKLLREDSDYITMQQDALRLVKEGVTDLEEIRRVLG